MNNLIFGSIQQNLSSFFDNQKFTSIAILVDENTVTHCYPIIKELIPAHHLIKIPSGEKNKTLATCESIWEDLTHHKSDRNALLINLGGGVIGDMGGFCASTFKRGISFINIPTTLLSMVDASVGGKTGIDFNGFKNHIGLFAEPNAVFIDSIFLKTLNKKQLLSGGAEMIKHGLISSLSLETIFNHIQQLDFPQHLIEESVHVKKAVVEGDFKERGPRKILNFGHTIGHAIESYFLEKDSLLHGEAIMIGMICELFLSIKKLGLDAGKANIVIRKISSIYTFRKIKKEEKQEIVELAIQDKKNKNGKIKCVLLEAIGQAKYDIHISSQDVVGAIEFYNSLVEAN